MSRVSPNKDVRDEIRILERLGFTYNGPDSAGHLVYEHDMYGTVTLPCSPAQHGGWRHRHRRAVARRMGLSVPELEALIHGQARVGKRRRRGKVRGQRQRPVLTAAPSPAPPTEPVPVPVFAPDGPITAARTEHWEQLQDRARREYHMSRYPWRAAA